jgi:hypothetical protein
MRIRFTSTALLACAALSGCAPARIALPSDVTANMEKLELTGMGGWQDGHFRLGASEGRFSRRATTTAILNTFVRNAGSGSFEISGPELGGSAGGRCGFEEREIDAGVAVLPNDRLTYRCVFHRDGRPVQGGLMLAEVPHGSGLLAGHTRVGELRLDQFVVNIRPIHHMRGGSLPNGTPLGYSFDVAGRQVGAVDLNGRNKTIYAPRQPGPERDAVLMAALALSVFWDPGA